MTLSQFMVNIQIEIHIDFGYGWRRHMCCRCLLCWWVILCTSSYTLKTLATSCRTLHGPVLATSRPCCQWVTMFYNKTVCQLYNIHTMNVWCCTFYQWNFSYLPSSNKGANSVIEQYRTDYTLHYNGYLVYGMHRVKWCHNGLWLQYDLYVVEQCGTEWPIMCWCAVKKLLTHSL